MRRPTSRKRRPGSPAAVVLNLLVNATKFTPRGATVEIVLIAAEAHAEIRIIDTGTGIEPSLMPHIVDGFRQAAASPSRVHGGLGLGLTIARHIAELHGGQLKWPRAGIYFRHRRTMKGMIVASRVRRRHGLGVGTQRGELRGIKVLIIDDDPDALMMLQRVVEDQIGICDHGIDSDQALDILARQTFNVIVSDIAMPGGDGYHFIATVRGRGRAGARSRRNVTLRRTQPMKSPGTQTSVCRGVVAVLVVAAATACSGQADTAPPATAAPPASAATAPPDDAPIPPTASPFDALPDSVRLAMDEPFTGDFDALVARRAIRVAVTFNRTHYFIDKGQERGITYEALKQFENDLNADLKTGHLPVKVLMLPMSRDQLYPALASGKVDMVAAMVTVTPEREQLVVFSDPTRSNVSQVVVTGPGAPPITTVDDLGGQEVFVRKGSIYDESLTRLNEQLKARGKPSVIMTAAPDVLEEDDVLEMVNAGLAPITVVDDYLAEFWSKVLPDITVHKDIVLRSGGTLAVAFRKKNPKLRAVVNTWIRKHGKGDGFRNVIERRYLESVKYAKNAAANAERKKFAAVVALFQKYGAQYKLDYLLMAAQGYQESTLDHSVRSPAGAIGVMQVMPATGKELNVGDITEVEPNIHAGVKYMRFMIDQYFKDEPMDNLNKALMTFASYNAGPGRMRQLRRETEKRGLNPNVWFGNVERITSERIGRETVTYVSNIYKYYITYRLLAAQRERRDAARVAVGTGSKQ
jgi:membrane-bound lytic murein transglycosylase MltF/CheY-like chemotaxis protein